MLAGCSTTLTSLVLTSVSLNWLRVSTSGAPEGFVKMSTWLSPPVHPVCRPDLGFRNQITREIKPVGEGRRVDKCIIPCRYSFIIACSAPDLLCLCLAIALSSKHTKGTPARTSECMVCCHHFVCTMAAALQCTNKRCAACAPGIRATCASVPRKKYSSCGMQDPLVARIPSHTRAEGHPLDPSLVNGETSSALVRPEHRFRAKQGASLRRRTARTWAPQLQSELMHGAAQYRTCRHTASC